MIKVSCQEGRKPTLTSIPPEHLSVGADAYGRQGALQWPDLGERRLALRLGRRPAKLEASGAAPTAQVHKKQHPGHPHLRSGSTADALHNVLTGEEAANGNEGPRAAPVGQSVAASFGPAPSRAMPLRAGSCLIAVQHSGHSNLGRAVIRAHGGQPFAK